MSISNPKTKNRLLWTAQILVAALFLLAGSMKFIMPVEKMQEGPMVFPVAFLYFIGACECLGAVGLIIPAAFRIRTFLTPLAAIGLTLIMAGATTVSILAMGPAAGIFPGVVGLLTSAIAYGRVIVAPIADGARSPLLRFA